MATIYVTKYALTKGILKLEGAKIDGTCATHKVDGYDHYYHSGSWFPSGTEALRQAEQMRLDRIASLKKQIAKLEKMNIKVKES